MEIIRHVFLEIAEGGELITGSICVLVCTIAPPWVFGVIMGALANLLTKHLGKSEPRLHSILLLVSALLMIYTLVMTMQPAPDFLDKFLQKELDIEIPKVSKESWWSWFKLREFMVLLGFACAIVWKYKDIAHLLKSSVRRDESAGSEDG